MDTCCEKCRGFSEDYHIKVNFDCPCHTPTPAQETCKECKNSYDMSAFMQDQNGKICMGCLRSKVTQEECKHEKLGVMNICKGCGKQVAKISIEPQPHSEEKECKHETYICKTNGKPCVCSRCGEPQPTQVKNELCESCKKVIPETIFQYCNKCSEEFLKNKKAVEAQPSSDWEERIDSQFKNPYEASWIKSFIRQVIAHQKDLLLTQIGEMVENLYEENVFMKWGNDGVDGYNQALSEVLAKIKELK